MAFVVVLELSPAHESALDYCARFRRREYDGMPLATLAGGAVNFTLEVDQIPRKLLELRVSARAIRLP